MIAPGQAYLQTQAALERIKAALQEAGASLEDLVQTRIYVTDISRWQEIGRAHGEVFGALRPVTAMVQVARLIDPDGPRV